MSLGRAFLESLSHQDHHREAWLWIEDHTESYPDGLHVQPYQRPRGSQKAKPLATAELLTPRSLGELGQDGHYLSLYNGEQEQLVLLPKGPGAADALDANLFTNAYRGRLVIFRNGQHGVFPSFLERYARDLVALGYRIHVIGSLHSIKALRVTKSRHVWWLCDAEAVTGVDLAVIDETIESDGSRDPRAMDSTKCLYDVLDGIQNELVRRFGARLYPTVGMTAVRAAARHIPEEALLWRPLPSMVSMLRAAGGFRGGAVWSDQWDGEAFKIDVRRMYTAALKAQLPWKVAFGPWHETGLGSEGLYLCTVQGPGKHHIRIARWNTGKGGFTHERWNSREAVCVLATHEFEAIMDAGFTVLPGYGFQFHRTFSLAGYAEQLELLTELHGPDSMMGQLCKMLGNQVWGKWSQSPTATDICFSADPPSAEWMPYQEGVREVEGVWTREVTSYRQHQHIELASIITAVGRAQLYRMLTELHDRGIRVRAYMTDSIIAEGRPPPDLELDGRRFGQWRLEGHLQHVWLLRTNAYLWGAEVKWSGANAPNIAGFLALYDEKAGPGGASPDPDILPVKKRVASG